jgi:hypothetical protein
MEFIGVASPFSARLWLSTVDAPRGTVGAFGDGWNASISRIALETI